MFLWVNCKKNYDFFNIFKGVGSGGPDQLVRGTDPGIRIRTKMSRIPNTGLKYKMDTLPPPPPPPTKGYWIWQCWRYHHVDSWCGYRSDYSFVIRICNNGLQNPYGSRKSFRLLLCGVIKKNSTRTLDEGALSHKRGLMIIVQLQLLFRQAAVAYDGHMTWLS